MTKLTKISDKLFINLDEVESIEAIEDYDTPYSSIKIKITMRNGKEHETVIEWWRLSTIAPNHDALSDEQNDIINNIVELLTQDGYPSAYLDAFRDIIWLSNWSNYTEWALFQFVKHLDEICNLDMRLMDTEL